MATQILQRSAVRKFGSREIKYERLVLEVYQCQTERWRMLIKAITLQRPTDDDSEME